jgi:pyruvate, water dikinase
LTFGNLLRIPDHVPAFRPQCLRAVRIAWLLVSVSSVLALSACGTHGERAIRVRVRTTEGEPVASFLATLLRSGGKIESLACPEGTTEAAEALRCTRDGFEILGPERVSEITLRSKGNAFTSTRLGSGSMETLTVSALADAESGPEYATRLDGAECLRDLQELALPFQSDLGASYSVKFYIRDLRTEPKVYFQNTRKYPLHFDFARNVLGVSGTADQFALDTYTGLDRPAMAGTLIFYPAVHGPAHGATTEVEAPWTLNFFPSDPLTTEQVRLAHRLLEERLTCLSWAGAAKRLVYVPATSERENQAAADDSSFTRVGIGWMDHAELLGGLQLQALNDGVAYGTLQRLSPQQLATKVVSFRDILLLTRLPNELPLVGGTITEELQTPLAHVNIAARSRGTPNLAYPGALQDESVSSRLGALVRFEVAQGGFTLADATLDEARAFWEGRSRERYVPSFDSSTTGILSFADIGFADSIRVGTKAANLAELSHFLGENAPRKGLAIPFHYYEQFMATSRSSSELCDAAQADCVTGGRDATVCQKARELCLTDDGAETFAAFFDRVIQDPDFNQDTALRDAVLANLRYSIESTPLSPELGQLLDSRIGEVFQDAKVKIRSSTNAEDLPSFSGAGLYDSHAAYASGDKAASKVVTKVFASVFSFRGFEERSFWNIDQRAVRMGCAINQAFTGELANGVLITQNIADPTVYGMYVNVQQGEAAVTNPEQGELPEVFSILADTNYQIVRSRFSSLSPEAPLLSDGEIKTLYDAGALAQSHFAQLYGNDVILDIEFKLTPEHQIVFKQARPYTPH